MTAIPALAQNAWTLGKLGAVRLRLLTDRLHQKTLEADRARGFDAYEYLPWLCCPIRADRIDCRGKLEADGRILTDEEVLRRLRKAYWGGRQAPLGEISISSKCMTIDVRSGNRDMKAIRNAVKLVTTTDDSWRDRFDSLVKVVVPLKTIGMKVREGGVGFSSHLARGAVFLSIPRLLEFRDLELSINLAHEMGHPALMVLQAADRIVAGDLGEPVFSGVRKTNRPAIQSFHAMIALCFMVEYTVSRVQCPGSLSEMEQSYLQKRCRELTEDLKISVAAFNAVSLTPLGERLRDDCADLLVRVRSVAS